MGLEPLRPAPTLTDRVADQLRERILAGELAPGSRLVEARLAVELGISRGPVREALQRLRDEGLVRSVPPRGLVVVRFSARDLRELCELRMALETFAVRLVAAGRDAKVLDELDRGIGRLRAAAGTGNSAEVAAADLQFHQDLVRLSGNRRLHEAFTSLTTLLGSLLRLDAARFYDSGDEVLAEHEELLAVLRSGSPGRAADAFHEHVERSMDQILRLWEQAGDASPQPRLRPTPP
jgi:DNA-binding GntR family transcriptional regulator